MDPARLEVPVAWPRQASKPETQELIGRGLVGRRKRVLL
jgi:hypothetical protein